MSVEQVVADMALIDRVMEIRNGSEIRHLEHYTGMGSDVVACPWCNEALLVYDEAVGELEYCYHCSRTILIVNGRRIGAEL